MADHVKIVAEIGINHNGDLNLALKLIDAAKEAGADYVKFQKRTPRICVPFEQWGKMRSTPWGEMSYIEYKERLELSRSDYDVIDAYCKEIGIGWTGSAWDVPSVEFLEQYDIPFHKVASACLTDDELLEAMRKTGRAIVLSTGMSTLEEIDHAVSLIYSHLDCIMHCNSTYPCPPSDLNLNCIKTLQLRFPYTPIGYSGHEVGLPTTIAAVALGAEWIERHITLDRSMWGTDQSASIEPEGFKRLVRYIRVVEEAMGDGEKRITEGEIEPRARLRRVTV